MLNTSFGKRCAMAACFGACFGAMVTSASAQSVTASAADAVGTPGGMAGPTFTFSFTNYPLLSADFSFIYDATLLSFDSAASQVTVDGSAVPLNTYLAALGSTGLLALGDPAVPGNLTFSFIPNNSAALTSVVSVKTLFTLASGVTPNTPLTVSLVGHFDRDDLASTIDAVDLSAQITAVPEPGTWLMALAGLAGLAGLRQVRQRH